MSLDKNINTIQVFIFFWGAQKELSGNKLNRFFLQNVYVTYSHLCLVNRFLIKQMLAGDRKLEWIGMIGKFCKWQLNCLWQKCKRDLPDLSIYYLNSLSSLEIGKINSAKLWRSSHCILTSRSLLFLSVLHPFIAAWKDILIITDMDRRVSWVSWEDS